MSKDSKTRRKTRNLEIEQFYNEIGLSKEENRNYFLYLSNFSIPEKNNQSTIFIEAGITTTSFEDYNNARLEQPTE